MAKRKKIRYNAAFDENIADRIDDSVLRRFSSELMDKIEDDMISHKERCDVVQKYLEPSTAGMPGGSRAVNPIMNTIRVEFTAKTAKELMPPGGPVRNVTCTSVVDIDKRISQQKTEFLNWQMTEQIKEYSSELTKLLYDLPMYGSGFMRIAYSPSLSRMAVEYAPLEEVVICRNAKNYVTAERITHVRKIDETTYNECVSSGVWVDVLSGEFDGSEDPNAVNIRENEDDDDKFGYQSEGNKTRTIYDVYILADLLKDLEYEDGLKDKDGTGYAPYIVTIDSRTKMILSIRRRWDESVGSSHAIQYLVEFQFWPGIDAYGRGIGDFADGALASSTGIWRAVMDNAALTSSQTMVMLKGAGVTGQSMRLNIGEVNPIDGKGVTTDIRNVIIPVPYTNAIPQLMTIKEDVEGKLRGLSVSSIDAADFNQAAPVGTTLAMIEQQQISYSAIFKRLHDSLRSCVRTLCSLNSMHLPDRLEYPGGQIERDFFAGANDVEPVADPSIWCEGQRIAIDQSLLQMAQSFPQVYDMVKVQKRILSRMKIDPDDVLVDALDDMNKLPSQENMDMIKGTACKVYDVQNHLAHIAVHAHLAMNPVVGVSIQPGQPNGQQNAPQVKTGPLVSPNMLVAFRQHLAEHLSFLYQGFIDKVIVDSEIGPEPKDSAIVKALDTLREERDDANDDEELAFELSQKEANAISSSYGFDESAFEQASKQALITIQALDLAIQQMNKTAPDPNQTIAQAAMIEAQAKVQQAQVDAVKVQTDNKIQQMKILMDNELKKKQIEISALELQLQQQKITNDLGVKMIDHGSELNRIHRHDNG